MPNEGMRRAYPHQLRDEGHDLWPDDLGVTADTSDDELGRIAEELARRFATEFEADLIEPLDYLTVMRDDLAFDRVYDDYEADHEDHEDHDHAEIGVHTHDDDPDDPATAPVGESASERFRRLAPAHPSHQPAPGDRAILGLSPEDEAALGQLLAGG
ncbi:MAG: hypothetical protein ACYDC0_11540 [Acidimicrobiales bacterium]